MDDLLEGLIDILGDFWFELFAPVQLILGLLIVLGCGEVGYYLATGSWAG